MTKQTIDCIILAKKEFIMSYIYIHAIVVFLWAIFLTSFALSFWFKKYKKMFLILSSIFMVLVFYTGIELMYLFPNIAKSGMWIHIKLTIMLIVMGINLYLIFKFFKKTCINVLLHYFISILSFLIMYVLVFFKPF